MVARPLIHESFTPTPSPLHLATLAPVPGGICPSPTRCAEIHGPHARGSNLTATHPLSVDAPAFTPMSHLQRLPPTPETSPLQHPQQRPHQHPYRHPFRRPVRHPSLPHRPPRYTPRRPTPRPPPGLPSRPINRHFLADFESLLSERR